MKNGHILELCCLCAYDGTKFCAMQSMVDVQNRTQGHNVACPCAYGQGVSHDELMVPAFATAASSEASSIEGLEPREDLKEETRL